MRLGCSKRTLFCGPIEKDCQFSTALALFVTVMRLPSVTMPALPLTTVAPLGSWA
jgi:hypothetical protein